MRNVYFLAVFLLLFFGPAVLFQLGWVIDFSDAPAYQKLYPTFYFVFFMFWFALLSGPRNVLVNNKIEIRMLLLIFGLLLFMVARGEGNGFSMIINCLFLPVLVSVFAHNYGVKNEVFRINLKKIILYFFIANSVLAIVERIFLVNFFVYKAGSGNFAEFWPWDASMFRSTAFLGHPLSNALCTSVIMSFIFFSDLKLSYKRALIVIGFLAILCYNTRSSLMLWGVLLVGYVIYNVFVGKKISFKQKMYLLIFSLIGIAGAIYLVLSLGVGGRIVANGVDDSSTGARLLVWGILNFVDFNKVLIGHSSADIDLMMRSANLLHIENYWIIFGLRFGVIFLTLLVVAFVGLFRRYLKGYTSSQRTFLVVCFLLLSSSNNSLAVGVPAISVFFLCCVAMCKNYGVDLKLVNEKSAE